MPIEDDLSNQKEVLEPDVTTFRNPVSRRGLATLHAAQVREQAPLDDQGLLFGLLVGILLLRLVPKERSLRKRASN